MTPTEPGAPSTNGRLPSDAYSLDFTDCDEVREFLEREATTSTMLSEFIEHLQGGFVCRWCLLRLRPSAACPTPHADAGSAWFGDGRRRYCDRHDCEETGLVDALDPGVSRDRGQLHQHLEHLLAVLADWYAVDVDEDATHTGIEEAIADDENGGKDTDVLAAGLAAGLESG